MFSCGYCEIFKNSCFKERLRTSANGCFSENHSSKRTKNVEFQTDNVLLLLSNPGTYLVSKLLSVVLVSK